MTLYKYNYTIHTTKPVYVTIISHYPSLLLYCCVHWFYSKLFIQFMYSMCVHSKIFLGNSTWAYNDFNIHILWYRENKYLNGIHLITPVLSGIWFIENIVKVSFDTNFCIRTLYTINYKLKRPNFEIKLVLDRNNPLFSLYVF